MIVKHLCTFSDFRIKEFPVLKLSFQHFPYPKNDVDGGKGKSE